MDPFLTSSLISLGSSVGNWLFNKNPNEKLMQQQNQFNHDEAVLQRDWQSEQMALQMQWQDEQRRQQNEWQEQVQRSFYEDYNSPAARASQFRKAGLNPALAIDSAGLGTINASSGSSGAAPSGPSGALASSVSPPYMPTNAISSSFQDVASALASLATAKKSGVETKNLELAMDEQIKGLRLQNEATDLQNMLNRINLKYLDEKERVQLQQLVVNVANGALTGEEIKATIKKLGLESEKLGLDINQLNIFLEHYDEVLTTGIDKTKSEIAFNEAAADEASAQSSNLDAGTNKLRLESDKLIIENDFNRELYRLRKENLPETILAELEELLQRARAAHFNADILSKDAKAREAVIRMEQKVRKSEAYRNNMMPITQIISSLGLGSLMKFL